MVFKAIFSITVSPDPDASPLDYMSEKLYFFDIIRPGQIGGLAPSEKHLFSKELKRSSVVAKNATTAVDGKVYQAEYFNLDAIISVGYRVNSGRATRFRQWATGVLRDLKRAVRLVALTLMIAESCPQ